MEVVKVKKKMVYKNKYDKKIFVRIVSNHVNRANEVMKTETIVMGKCMREERRGSSDAVYLLEQNTAREEALAAAVFDCGVADMLDANGDKFNADGMLKQGRESTTRSRRTSAIEHTTSSTPRWR
jgi:hypothetical protein